MQLKTSSLRAWTTQVVSHPWTYKKGGFSLTPVGLL